jgi:plasmid stability protein
VASITIRRLDEGVMARLRLRAASHGWSMEEEVREILKAEAQAKIRTQTQLGDGDPPADCSAWRS